MEKLPLIIDWIRIVSERLPTLTKEEKKGYKLAFRDFASLTVAYDIPIEEIHKAFKRK